jgi:hypothetical protein
MYHITGKIYGFDPIGGSLMISVDKSLVKDNEKENGRKYFVPFVFRETKKADLVTVRKQGDIYIFTIENIKKLSDILSGAVSKTVSIRFRAEKEGASKAIENDLAAFVIME